MVDLSKYPDQNGREKCENCGRRNTEITGSRTLTNAKDFECNDCGNEWVKHTGPSCPDCDSQKTFWKTVGAAPHQSREVACKECGRNVSSRLLKE